MENIRNLDLWCTDTVPDNEDLVLIQYDNELAIASYTPGCSFWVKQNGSIIDVGRVVK